MDYEATMTDYEAMTMDYEAMKMDHEATMKDYEATKTSVSQPSSNGFKPSSLSISTGNGCDFNFSYMQSKAKLNNSHSADMQHAVRFVRH